MLYVIESSKPLDRVAEDLRVAVARHKFGVLSVHDLRAKLAEKGVAFAHECRDHKAGHDQADGPDRALRDPDIKAVAEDVEATLERIMAEAAR